MNTEKLDVVESDEGTADAPVHEDRTDLLGELCTQRPLEYLNRLRATDPVHWNARHRSWIVTSYQAVGEGLRNPKLLSNRIRMLRERIPSDKQATVGKTLGLLEQWMVFQDNPDHRRLKGVVHKAFTPQTVAKHESDIRTLAREQVDRLTRELEDGADKPIDILNDVAYEIPGPIICRMLGVPQEDRPQFITWTEEMSSVVSGFGVDSDPYEATHAAVTSLVDYLNDLMDRMGSGEDNLISQLLDAEKEGERLTREEVIGTATLLLFGGNRTTSGMMANGIRALLLHPDQLTLLNDDPGLLDNALAEILRWEAHTKVTVRVAGEDFEWFGKRIRKGDRVFLSPLAANHDPSVFDEPGRFDITRANANRNIAFGTGIHLCLGMPLAQLELKVFFQEILATLPRLRLVAPEGNWMPSFVSRVQRELMVSAKG